MIQIENFFKPLLDEGYDYYTGVPCSFFKSAINYALDNDKTEFYMASNEGAAVAMGAGAWLGGRKAVIMMQNSGFGNTVSPLTSLNYIYNIPAMVLISGRAFGVKDEPQHELLGRRMTDMMDAMELKWDIIPDTDEEWAAKVKEAQEYIDKTGQPFLWIARKGGLSDYPAPSYDNGYEMTRFEAIKWLADYLQQNEPQAAVFATTGMIGRELYEAGDRKEYFYMMGSMGHAPAMALGFAQAQKDKKSFVFDGDGALIMHTGTLSTIGHYGNENVYHVLIDNHIHESTGGQRTTADSTDFCALARAAGYKKVYEVSSKKDLESTFSDFCNQQGPVFIRILVSAAAKKGTPRITESHSSADIARNFRQAHN